MKSFLVTALAPSRPKATAETRRCAAPYKLGVFPSLDDLCLSFLRDHNATDGRRFRITSHKQTVLADPELEERAELVAVRRHCF